MRVFRNIAKLIRHYRIKKNMSATELSRELGYKTGQFVNNIESEICGMPLKLLNKTVQVLDIPTDKLKQAILEDQYETINNFLEKKD